MCVCIRYGIGVRSCMQLCFCWSCIRHVRIHVPRPVTQRFQSRTQSNQACTCTEHHVCTLVPRSPAMHNKKNSADISSTFHLIIHNISKQDLKQGAQNDRREYGRLCSIARVKARANSVIGCAASSECARN
jgi:hypothetical protein